MIILSENIQLKPVLSADSIALFKLMKEVYPLAYSHFWLDKGDWYVDSQYSTAHILKELSAENAEYYFVIYKDEIVGNFRFVWDEKLLGLSEEKQVKLHRIYLHQKTQGKGIGKEILAWLDEKVQQKGYEIIWLDAMDAQPKAFQFYKNRGYTYHSHTFLPFNLMLEEVRKMSQLYKKL
ncbi:GNAT family N-acetyltransferase [Polaribacter filamentus]|uniref:GNAT family N-acetyltransferase n=1 Tax=Polaribacter filamentus TaxID=53483 RepID=A0A2S7KK78_9FLAO|nr:GNAT family N-acetyltransferase [Polaribacter filamentus]PQB03010.1 GNAT family N-acetyltransferase [Polaribacter filamentus]